MFYYLISFTALLTPYTALTATPTKQKSNAPIHISSLELEVDQKSHKAIYKGNVIATQDLLEVQSEHLTVHYVEDKNKQAIQDDIHKIEVKDHVRIKKRNKHATGDYGIYDIPTQTIYLYGKVILTQGTNIAEGNELIYHLDTDNTELKSSYKQHHSTKNPKNRVHAIITPTSKKDKTYD